MAEVLAAPPLDRLFGFAGTVALALIIAALVLVNHGFVAVEKLELQAPTQWIWLVLAIVLLGLLVLVVWAPRGEAAWKRTVRSFRSGIVRLARTPGLAVDGLLLAFLAQACFGAVFALNLAAVTHQNLYWGQIAWTFPTIMVIGSLPFTIAGAGVREAAALALLGLYSVPPGDCVAASLLTLACKLVWAAIGAVILWHEEIAFGKGGAHPRPETISIIVPTLNEAPNLRETIEQARHSPSAAEIIVVDGGSTDGTPQIARELRCRVLSTSP